MLTRFGRVSIVSLGLIALPGAVMAAAPSPLQVSAVTSDKGRVPPIDESDPQVIEARNIQKLEDLLGNLVTKSPETYAGLAAAGPGNLRVLIKDGVDPTGPLADIAAARGASNRPANSASLAAVPRSDAELRDLHAKVDALLPEMEEAGADISGTGPDRIGGKIQIDIISGQAAAERVLGALTADVQFVESSNRENPNSHGALTVGRYSDVAPWFGGNGIYMNTGGFCTAGFSVVKNSIRYMMTSGHCVNGVNGTEVDAAVNGVNGVWPSGFYLGSSRTHMGHSSQTEFSQQLDSSMISGSYSTHIWIGAQSTTTHWPLAGATSSEPVGAAVCHGGAVSGQQCGYAINISPYTWHYQTSNCAVKDAYLFNMVKAIGNSSGVMGGDSGATVYTRSPSGAEAVYARGTVSGNGCNTDLVYQPFYMTDSRFANGGLSVP